MTKIVNWILTTTNIWIKWSITNGVIIISQRKKCHTFFELRMVLDRYDKRKEDPARFNEQLFNASGDRSKLESAKKSRGFSSRCRTTSYEDSGTSWSNFYNTSAIYSTSCYDFIGFRWEDALKSRNSTNHPRRGNSIFSRSTIWVTVPKNYIRYWFDII